ncbi:Rhomboid family intramembrane serine protease [Candidatus Desulfarcum epimagneticum]|uniref:Rhomboid family intramembrane serine protease n=1 Tax=uncultured Desulfobacteraceae bacterium TaxID=218296 RepID=A0A484HC43_9BACT|nr:Rhomboid family intramembrane serine protease [uncultured Desulfobacteraceae bacterium]
MKNAFSRRFKVLFYLIAALWLFEAVNLLSGRALSQWGILPRTLSGLAGIPLSPFLHGGVGHLLLNTPPLAFLGALIIVSEGKNGSRAFVETTAFVILAGGAALWLAGRPAIHIGASGLVFGYFGYLTAGGIFKRRLSAAVTALVAAASYGGLLWGLSPALSGVSWEGHLFGLAAGVLAAKISKPPGKKF